MTFVDITIYAEEIINPVKAKSEKLILYAERQVLTENLPLYINIAKSIGYKLHKHIFIEVD